MREALNLVEGWAQQADVELIWIALLIQAEVFGCFCGWMAKKKNRSHRTWFALGFFCSIVAAFALIAMPKVERSSIAALDEGARWRDALAAPQNHFDGQPDIAKPPYQLFLARRFGISKHATLDKFVIGRDVFDDLRAALAVANERYEQQLAESAARQLAWSSTGEIVNDGPDCPDMVLIPAGRFVMGSGAGGEVYETPTHQVTLAAFLLGRTAITRGQWQAVMGSSPRDLKVGGMDLPMANVSWDDAQEFATRLSQKSGKTYRLPSEAEWEYAARVGSTGHWNFGDDELQLATHAWFSENSRGKAHPVGQKAASAIGLYDMHGNVWEWVQDTWHETYQGAPIDGSAWVRGGSAERVLRGGSAKDYPRVLWSAFRHCGAPDDRSDNTGMRIARTL
jgi:formylglycine-generating enzyme required for sulfatase activity